MQATRGYHAAYSHARGSEMEDDMLAVDSPEQEAVDDIEDEETDDLALPSSVAPLTGGPFAPSSSTAAAKSKARQLRPREKPREQQLDYPNSLPYQAESLDDMDAKLDLILRRLMMCVKARDYDIGLIQWNHRLECWISMKYPMPRKTRARLARLYFEIAVLPGMDARLVEVAANMCMTLLEPKKKIDISDLRLPWRKLYAILEKELFPKTRKTGITNMSSSLLNLTEFCQRFFPPHEIPSMLAAFLPRISSNLNSILATQAFCVHFLPLSHPQNYLPAIFELWGAFNSGIYDEQWVDFLERLAVKHLDPRQSDPAIIKELENLPEEQEVGEGQVVAEEAAAVASDDGETKMEEDTTPAAAAPPVREAGWQGIRKDVGLFTDDQWSFLMTKLLRTLGVPIGGGTAAGGRGEGLAASDFAGADQTADTTSLTMKRPADKLASYAAIVVSSMAVDAEPAGATPMSSKPPSRVPSSSNLAAAGTEGAKLKVEGKKKTYLAGSKALDSLAKLIQATESFFHPSNYGKWAPVLGKFLHYITFEFMKRQKEEEKATCQTPKRWRLTKEIRVEFVKTMRTVALLSMFSRDPITIMNAQTALKTMGFLEPDLVFPPLLERAYPALEQLTETHRTTAAITALSCISPGLVSRENYPAGAKHLLPLLELCIPGLDVNDPIKTMSTGLFIIQALAPVMIDDLTRPEVAEIESADGKEDDGTAMDTDELVPTIAIDEMGNEHPPVLTRAQEDAAVRDMTAGFPDWVAKFFRQVLVIFEALPEPGKHNKTGGKSEEQMTQTLIAACDYVVLQLSEPLFDLALDIVYRHATSSIRANSSKVTSQLVTCFARAEPEKTFAKFFDICDLNIRAELEQGAGGTRSTSTHSLEDPDVTLHWWIGLLQGSLAHAGHPSLLKRQDDLISLISFTVEHCKAERSYSAASRLPVIMMSWLLGIWPEDARSVNRDEWTSDAWKRSHHKHWGKLYQVDEVKINWHVPSQDEIALALRVLRDVGVPALDVLEGLLADTAEGAAKSQVWTNDFCRHISIVKALLSSIGPLTKLPRPSNPGAVATDTGDEVAEFIDHLPEVEAGICITDPNDPRHQFVASFRKRTGRLLHAAAGSLKASGAEDSIDCVKAIIGCTRTLLLQYPCDPHSYAAIKKSYDHALSLSRTTRAQKKFPRIVWVRRASLYHASRQRLCSFYRRRTELDDKLISDICDLSLSSYVAVRKSAQRALDSFTHYFDGTRALLYERLFDALKPGTDADVMKGALFVLGGKMFANVAILDWRYTPRYTMTLLACSHQEKPSIQGLVKTIIHDFILRLAEPSTLKAFVASDAVNHAVDMLEPLVQTPDSDLTAKVAEKALGRVTLKNQSYADLVPQLLTFANDSTTHWRYALSATRLIRALVRRDQPLRPDVAEYVATQIISDLPNQRSHSTLALTKILHFIKLRSLCGDSDENLLLQKTINPLKRKVKLARPLPANFTEDFIESLAKPLTGETLLMDKKDSGWLVWGDEIEFYAIPPETEWPISWDPKSQEALAKIRSIVMSGTWWDTLAKHMSQEKTIDYLSADACTLIKSIFQVFGDEPLQFVLPILDSFIADPKDRHKQRAAGELMGGMFRGSKHWPQVSQRKIWEWATPLFPKIFEQMTPETQPAWEMMAEYILVARDPRRNQPLVDYLTSLEIDQDSTEAFNTAKKQDLVGVCMKTLNWHFLPWADKYIKIYSEHLDHPYQEVRGAVADNLRHLSELRLHPSYSSTAEFVEECQSQSGSTGGKLTSVDAGYESMVDEFGQKLEAWRAIRVSSAQGTQTYDKAAITILTWIWTTVIDFRTSTAFPFINKLFVEFFRMQEVLDNVELRTTATRVVLAIACLPFPQDMSRHMMRLFLDLLKTSDSWRVRLDLLLPLQMFYFHNIFLLDDEVVAELMDQLCDLLRDPKVEVREAAGTALSSIVRCSQRSQILVLRERFMAVIRSTRIPRRRTADGSEAAGYSDALVKAHSAVLGVIALINAFPYEVPPFIPSILIETMSLHNASPPPISTAVKACLASFKRSHTDSWAEDQKAFTADQLMSLNDLLVGSSYYA